MMAFKLFIAYFADYAIDSKIDKMDFIRGVLFPGSHVLT